MYNNDDNENLFDENDYNLIESFKEKELLLKGELEILNNQIINENEIEKQALDFVINQKLDNFKKNIIIEKTPLGNVLMFYNNVKESFEYYSDNIIPYRYLETVARKYVITYKCKSLFVNMKEELDDYEKKEKEKEDNEKKKREEEDNEKKKREEEDNLKEIRPLEKKDEKKSVFAKFKNYNKEAGYGKVNMVPHSKNNIPNNISKNQSEKIILKEKTNRYTYSGKFANYNLLQKVDRKIVDKKYKMTFAEYKKSQIKNE